MTEHTQRKNISEEASQLSEDETRNRVFETIIDVLQQEDYRRLQTLLRMMHPADIADLLSTLDNRDLEKMILALTTFLNGEILVELNESVLRKVLMQLSIDNIARIMGDLETADTVYLLEHLPATRAQAVLSRANNVDRASVELVLKYPEDSAARLMRDCFLAVPCFWSVGQTVDYCMDAEDLPEKFYEIYVVDPSYRPVGSIVLAELLRARRSTRVDVLAVGDALVFSADVDEKEVAYKFEHYHLNSAAVIGEDGRLIGSLLVDDVLEVVVEKAEDDIKNLAGVGGEDIADTLPSIIRSRGWWLLINLMTAIAAALIINYYGDVIKNYVILAALAPLVASMGGNAGSQSLTVAIRAIAMRTVTSSNVRRMITKEFWVGLINGLLFALAMIILILTGLGLGLWQASYELFIVVGLSMVIELLAATLAGIMIPLILHNTRIDPAVSGVVLVTTVTDVVGFFSVLGLATCLL